MLHFDYIHMSSFISLMEIRLDIFMDYTLVVPDVCGTSYHCLLYKLSHNVFIPVQILHLLMMMKFYSDLNPTKSEVCVCLSLSLPKCIEVLVKEHCLASFYPWSKRWHLHPQNCKSSYLKFFSGFVCV